MSAGIDLRKRGKRREGRVRNPRIGSDGPMSAIDAGHPGEVVVSTDTMMALAHLYQTSPSIQAARTILMGQLLSSGVVVRRGGMDVELTDSFSKFLESKWLPFARDCIDSLLQFGFVVVALEPDDPPPFSGKRRADSLRKDSILGDASATRTKKVKLPSTDADLSVESAKNLQQRAENLVPIVPDLGSYQLSFVRTGESSYKREYRIFSTDSRMVFRQDVESEVFFRSEPDPVGNICSPVATVFQSASFISALEELALQAEVVRARSQIVTQAVQKNHQNQNLDPSNLFFDSESRAIQSSSVAEEDANQATSLAIAAKLMMQVNRVRTTNESAAAGPSGPTHVPPEVPPRLFAVPDKQQVVPNLRPPESRTDLVDLSRMVNDHVCAALGVPASVVFEGTCASAIVRLICL